MDANDYWQENKRFVTTVVGGGLVFLIAYMVLSSGYRGEISAALRQKSRLEGELKAALFTSGDLATAREENEALRAAVDQLARAVRFEARPRFRLEPGASPGSQYLRALTSVREELLPRANRANLKLAPDLGMPALSPTRQDEIERYLEALDLIDTVCNMAIQAGVRRIEKIDVRLDPGLNTRRGVGRIERTRVRFRVEGDALPITRLLALTQRPLDGRPLMIDEVEMVSSRLKPGEARLDLTIAAVRLSDPVPLDGGEG